jgi:hypothetical protein
MTNPAMLTRVTELLPAWGHFRDKLEADLSLKEQFSGILLLSNSDTMCMRPYKMNPRADYPINLFDIVQGQEITAHFPQLVPFI